MTNRRKLSSKDAIPHTAAHTTARRRLLTGAGAAGAAAVASQLAAPEASAVAPAPIRTNSNYYWESQQSSLGYSQGVQVDNTLWLSGTAALDADFNPVSPGNLAAQMEFIYERIRESLAMHSLDFRACRSRTHVRHRHGRLDRGLAVSQEHLRQRAVPRPPRPSW